jgi:hypothetical protein
MSSGRRRTSLYSHKIQQRLAGRVAAPHESELWDWAEEVFHLLLKLLCLGHSLGVLCLRHSAQFEWRGVH